MTNVSSQLQADLARLLYSPTAAVLLWGLALHGKLDRDALAILGLKDVDPELLESTFSTQLQDIRRNLKLSEYSLPDLGRLLRGLCGGLLADAQHFGNPALIRKAGQALAHMPLFAREPELYALEMEGRRANALARLEEANLRREELRGRRLKLKLLNDQQALESATGASGPDAAALQSPPGQAQALDPATGSGPLDRPGELAGEAQEGVTLAEEYAAEPQGNAPAELVELIDAARAANAKVPLSAAFSAAKVKSAAAS